jgi:hypothetical protein
VSKRMSTEAAFAKRLLAELGLVATAKHLRISHPTLTKLLNGLPVAPGSLALVREAMREAGAEP